MLYGHDDNVYDGLAWTALAVCVGLVCLGSILGVW